MDRAAPLLESFQALEMRVSAGPQRGARAALRPGVACVIAAGPDAQTAGADIVLRDDQATAARVRLQADLPHGMLEVLQGEVKLGDQVLAAGGRADVWLALTGLAVLLLSGAVVGVAYLQARPPTEPAAMVGDDPVAALSRRLRESEFGMLDVTTRGNGQVVIRGRLATEAQRDKLAQWLQDGPLVPALELVVDESLVREVTEVFRINGIAVSAQAVGPGQVATEAAERDGVALARAAESVRRDVRGLVTLNVRNTVRPAPPPAPPVSDDPGKRIASLVAGASAYLVTVDGARYFVGAILPTGHRIVAIERTAVALERDGQRTSLNF